MTHIKLPSNVTIYEVGGCVRDSLLGHTIKDRDYLVVGATPQDMLNAGFIKVGADFPVFLHPHTKDEYALARTERKQGSGYHGFTVYAAPNVTLEDDLSRRDFTMNAMARDSNGIIYDPHNGLKDLNSGMIRHVSKAFEEDPLRILRAARFAARYNFSINTETWKLMQEMVNRGQLNELTKERIVLEFTKNINSNNPPLMWDILDRLNVLGKLVPEVIALKKSWSYIKNNLVAPTNLWGLLLFLSDNSISMKDLKNTVHTYKYPKETLYTYHVLQVAAKTKPWENEEQAVDYWSTSDARRHTFEWRKIQPIVQSIYPQWSTVYSETVQQACSIVQEGLIVETLKSSGKSIRDLPVILKQHRIKSLNKETVKTCMENQCYFHF